MLAIAGEVVKVCKRSDLAERSALFDFEVMPVVNPRSSSRYLYKTAIQSKPHSFSIRPDCKQLIVHEMPHACARDDSVVRMHYGLG